MLSVTIGLAFLLGFYFGGLLVSLASMVIAMRMHPIMADEMKSRPVADVALFLARHLLLWPFSLIVYLQQTAP